MEGSQNFSKRNAKGAPTAKKPPDGGGIRGGGFAVSFKDKLMRNKPPPSPPMEKRDHLVTKLAWLGFV